MEYTGEIITQEESERRMIEDYKDNNVSHRDCFVLFGEASPLLTSSCQKELLSHAFSPEYDS